MARRGEGQFVAIEVNLRGDPVKVGRLCRRLKVSRNEAVGIIAAWREIVLTKGTATGLVKDFPAADIADVCDWRGPPRKLVQALADAKELVNRRGGAYAHPYWEDTPTGWYAARRAADRERKRIPPNGNGHGDSAEPPRNGHAGSAPAPSGSGQEERPSGAPQGAPQGGAADRASRWEWFEASFPIGIEDPAACTAILGDLSPDDWDHLKYALIEQASKNRWKHTPWRVPPALRYLRKREWRRIKWKPGMKKPDPKAPQKAQAEPKPDRAELDRQQRLFARSIELREQLRKAGLKGFDLESAIEAEMVKEQQQGGAPS